jgi:2,4-dienoyl-CoA reductase-like NADH-dependent reductase (Old Yellow Enzyme family)
MAKSRMEDNRAACVAASQSTPLSSLWGRLRPTAAVNGVLMATSLFSPIKLAGIELDNRIVVAPMCQYSANDGCASDWHTTHLGMLSNSGAGLVVVEATHVERHGRITHGCLGLYSDDCELTLKQVIEIGRRYGTAKFGIQLAHAGRKASSQRPWEGGGPLKPGEDPWETMGPSALPFGPGWHVPREMTAADIARVREAFVAAAQRAIRIGFDAIELHGAHGYLIHSFMSPFSNKRTDEYGGSFANRLRFPLEVARAVRAVVPRSIALGARITGSDWLDGGLTPADAVAFTKALKEVGLDYVDVSSGGIVAEARTPTTPGYNVPIADEVRRATGIATRTVGLIVMPKQADEVIAEGKADMVALARAVLDNPHWGWYAAQVLGAETKRPPQYLRASSKLWPGMAMRG